ncbi:MAG: hypothetical protein JSR93_09765 [Verrucomicrobia bacterium]|nr:hypothetical protein [Verrucomicrobiota bacterium]
MTTKVEIKPVEYGHSPTEQVRSTPALTDEELISILEKTNVNELEKKTAQYRTMDRLDCSGISSAVALQWQTRISGSSLLIGGNNIQGNNFPFSDQFDCTFEQLSEALGDRRSLELIFITPSERTLNAIIALMASNRLEHLELRGFVISDNSVDKLSMEISSSTALRSLVLQNLRLNTDHFIRLSSGIKGSQSIEEIMIKSDWVKERAVPYILEMIKSSNSLKKICLTLDKFEKIPTLASLQENLKDNQTLDLSENWGY